MIASRFRSVGWVAGVAVAALGCYLVSQRVAAERAELAKVERRILAAKHDIRYLQTEISTRGGLHQIERWNVEVLALAAPKPGQFLAGEVQLASFMQPPAPAAPSRDTAPAAAPAPIGPKVLQVGYRSDGAAAAAAPARPMLRPATYIKPKNAPGAAPIQRVALLSGDLLGEIGQIAASERASAKKKIQ